MDTDQLILAAIVHGHLVVDHESGIVYRTRGSKGVVLDNPIVVNGCDLNGYRACKLVLNGCRKMIRLHRIIWISVNGPIPDGLMIDHINRNRIDNRLANLRLVDAKGNAQNRERLAGELNPSAKLTQDQVSEIRRIYINSDMNMRDLSDLFGISKSQIQNIISGNSWKYNPGHFDAEPDIHRVAAGIPQRAAKLKALGNSIVPEVAYQILRHLGAAP